MPLVCSRILTYISYSYPAGVRHLDCARRRTRLYYLCSAVFNHIHAPTTLSLRRSSLLPPSAQLHATRKSRLAGTHQRLLGCTPRDNYTGTTYSIGHTRCAPMVTCTSSKASSDHLRSFGNSHGAGRLCPTFKRLLAGDEDWGYRDGRGGRCRNRR